MYLEEPWTVNAGPYHSHLRGSQQVNNMELYLERNKDVGFIVFKDYQCCREKSHPTSRYHLGREVDAPLMSMLKAEHIDIVSDDLRSTLANLSDVAFEGIPHPKFGRVEDVRGEDEGSEHAADDDSSVSDIGENPYVSYPYLWYYHRRHKISEAIDCLEDIDKEHLNVFCGYIQTRMSDEWAAVDKLISKGEISAEYIKYIYVSFPTKAHRSSFLLSQTPGEFVVWAREGSARTKLQAYLVKEWLSDRFDPTSEKISPTIMAECWSFDGKFQRSNYVLHIDDLPSSSHPFKICELKPYPLKFSDDNLCITENLRERGNMFWRCRSRNYVCFKSFVDDGIKTAVSSYLDIRKNGI